MADTILVQEAGDIVTVVLNRPEKLNALTKPMWQRLGEVFEELSARDDVRCVILRGAGTKAFAPGNDISEFANERSNVEQARAYGEVMRRTIEAIGSCRHPVVAQIHGICVGGGLEIAGLADIRICGASSRFGVPINKLGLGDGLCGDRVADPPRGRGERARDPARGRVFDAAEAKDKGLRHARCGRR
jgi:enoyl-CoA hydratase/carnithine racemase